MDTIIKVDRVATVNEALELQGLEVNIIGVSLNESPTCSNSRALRFRIHFTDK